MGNFNWKKMRKETFNNMAKSDSCALWVYLTVVPTSGVLVYAGCILKI